MFRGFLHLFLFGLSFYTFAVPSFPGWAIKNWAPTLIADKLHIDMSLAGPLTTISISLSSLFGVIVGGYFSDKVGAAKYKGTDIHWRDWIVANDTSANTTWI